MRRYSISFDKSQKELMNFCDKTSFEGIIKIKCLQVIGQYNLNCDSIYLSDRFIRRVEINDYLTYFIYMSINDNFDDFKDIIYKIDLLTDKSRLELGIFSFNFPNSELWNHLNNIERYQLLKYNDNIFDYHFRDKSFSNAIDFIYDYESLSFEFYYQDFDISIDTIYNEANELEIDEDDFKNENEISYLNSNLEVNKLIYIL